jgi:hypothetical protein
LLKDMTCKFPLVLWSRYPFGRDASRSPVLQSQRIAHSFFLPSVRGCCAPRESFNTRGFVNALSGWVR